MRTAHILFLVLLASALAACQHTPPDMGSLAQPAAEAREGAAVSSAFVVGAGDELTLRVWRHDDFAKDLNVDPQGDVYIPMLGRVHIAGMTMNEVREMLAQRLAKYIVDPQVDVSISSVRSRRAYILGEVRDPGIQTFYHDLYFMDALTTAGGFGQDANLDEVLLLRLDQEGIYRPHTISMNIKATDEQGFDPASFLVNKGDIIYVLPTTMASIERFMSRLETILAPVVSTERGIVLWPDVKNAVLNNQDDGGDSTIVVAP
jgi:polysaccharide export outer membrane protein